MSKISDQLNRLNRELTDDQLAKKAYRFFRQTTPIDTGNARRRTKLSNNQILAQYPYAGRLDQGYSDQAPDGMVKPTIDYLRREIEKLPK